MRSEIDPPSQAALRDKISLLYLISQKGRAIAGEQYEKTDEVKQYSLARQWISAQESSEFFIIVYICRSEANILGRAFDRDFSAYYAFYRSRFRPA